MSSATESSIISGPRYDGVRLPDAPVVVSTPRDLVCLSPDGELERIALPSALPWLHDRAVIACNARLLARRLGVDGIATLDVLELFAFVRPALACVPTPSGLAQEFGLAKPASAEQSCLAIAETVRRLLVEAGRDPDARTGPLAAGMAAGGWPWAEYILAARHAAPDSFTHTEIRRALTVWTRLPEWQEAAQPTPAGQQPVAPHEARRRLAEMVRETITGAPEPRPQQADYASAACFAFTPRQEEGEPQAVLAEAGTGVGKTLGYLAPATLWAERNGAPVWISTYTRNLQRQIDQAMQRHYGDPETAQDKVVVRKGRENYLCLLNLDESLRSTAMQPVIQPALGLMVRWAGATRDGDFSGDFPFWLSDLLGKARTTGLSDRRGECIYSACEHYARCFIEHSVRRARTADIVVANHALVMIQAANGGADDTYRPLRYVFDEGHHLFDTADSAFSANLSGLETSELRRWLIGAEASNRSRARGLKRRLSDLMADNPELEVWVDRIVEAARVLPGDGWLTRVAEGTPLGDLEAFLSLVRRQVYARSAAGENPYSLEAEIAPALPGLQDAAQRSFAALGTLVRPISGLIAELKGWLDRDAATLAEDKKRKIESVGRSLGNRGLQTVTFWQGMLTAIGAETPSQFVDWFQIDRFDGRDYDNGFHRHWVDPTKPFAEVMSATAHGMLVTSATLTDTTGDPSRDWAGAEMLSGAAHLAAPAIRAQVTSPFDYPEATRIYVVRDVKRNDIDQIASAYRELFLASGGGGLGLFTAISRLRAVYDRIASSLEAGGIDLHAQHVDGLNPTTLIDIFRAEENACLLGTDAIRDGVDVPGRSLRLLVFDRVPWSRPDILYKARRAAFGAAEYEDRLTRLRLKQAFGRLIRRADDRGVFVLLDSMLPSRLTTAFPPGVVVQRVGLAEAVAGTKEFLGQLPTNPNMSSSAEAEDLLRKETHTAEGPRVEPEDDRYGKRS